MDRDRVVGRASGPFAQAPEAGDKRGGIFGPGSGMRSGAGGGGGGGGMRIKTDGGGYRSGGGGGGGGGGGYSEPVYPEELEEGADIAPRTDIEYINLISDDEDDVVTGQSRARNKGKGLAGGHAMNPIRLTRHEHKVRVMLVNTDSSSGEPKTEVEDVVKIEAPEESGLFFPQEEPVVKSEPGVQAAGADKMEVDATPMGDIQAGAEAEASPSTTQETPKPAPEKPSAFLAANAKKPVLQTEEDEQEYERYLEDIDILARELGGMSTTAPPQTDGDVAIGEDTQISPDHKEGRLYLFQFPPILPKLANAEHLVKPDPGDADVQLSDIPSGTIDLDDTPEVKAEPAAEADADVPRPINGSKAKDALVQEPGLIGKLVVRRSGKVELSWGGTSLALGRGAEFDFLTTGVVVQGLGAEKGEGGGEEMSGTGMGRVMGKIVATPDWEKLFG
ncbi:hypothetical protein GMDG_05409 [Pseudogymnoascus destructans 20631-21]|uniref:DNA-directed RNA polymerase III subunit RPC4 n=1 Tax=Pseudogymnoascus destructans (strain ATCC MYA-4855 / 20631-21) TaxID=658429 RepID=L8FN45_PSED2|nr:hypothetical protein GMDG_05409 [Pseudogymnoascus destructans 20631-21]